MLDCIHVCVFLLSENCFQNVARLLLDTSSTPCYLLSFLSLFHIAIPIAPWYLVDRSSFYSWIWWIVARYLLDTSVSTSIFSTPTLTASSTPLDTSFVELYWRFYLSLLVRSDPYFTWYLSRLLSVFSPKLSDLTPISILKGFFNLFQVFLPLVSF